MLKSTIHLFDRGGLWSNILVQQSIMQGSSTKELITKQQKLSLYQENKPARAWLLRAHLERKSKEWLLNPGMLDV